MVSIAVLILATAIAVGLRWSQQEFSPHRYGVKPIVLADGQKLYLKREVGLHYDRAALSLNSDRCIGPNDVTDYVFSSSGAGEFPLYFQPGKNAMIVYDSGLNSPSRTNWTITIKQESLLNEPHFGGREEDYHARGISKVEISLSELSVCREN
jgi:hypothetical protein